jgi:hypothetical protein
MDPAPELNFRSCPLSGEREASASPPTSAADWPDRSRPKCRKAGATGMSPKGAIPPAGHLKAWRPKTAVPIGRGGWFPVLTPRYFAVITRGVSVLIALAFAAALSAQTPASDAPLQIFLAPHSRSLSRNLKLFAIRAKLDISTLAIYIIARRISFRH